MFSSNGVAVRRVYPIIKLAARGEIVVVVQTDGWVAVNSHWIETRAQVCPGEGCRYCRDVASVPRCHWWAIVGLSGKGGGLKLLEVPAASLAELQSREDLPVAEGWSGTRLRVTRPAKNRRVELDRIEGKGRVVAAAASEVAVMDAIAQVYGLPQVAGQEVAAWLDDVRAFLVRWWERRLG